MTGTWKKSVHLQYPVNQVSNKMSFYYNQGGAHSVDTLDQDWIVYLAIEETEEY